MGNEACDLDSMVSALTFAYFLSKVRVTSYLHIIDYAAMACWGCLMLCCGYDALVCYGDIGYVFQLSLVGEL